MRVIDFLDKSEIDYRISEHSPAFTAQSMAAVEHESGRFVAKPVVVKVDGEFIMCVLPGCYKIDLQSLKHQLRAASVELADERDISRIFVDCALGAEPPFGNLYDLATFVDKSLLNEDHITFQAGTHERAIHMRTADYVDLVKPRQLDFSYHPVM